MIEQRAVPQRPGDHPVRSSSMNASKGESTGWIFGEPSVGDLLHDPVVHAVLNRDGLSPQDLLQAIAIGRSRLAPAAVRLAASDAA